MIRLKNVFEMPGAEDGFRLLIERFWPPEADLYLHQIHRWMKDLSPSYDLMEWLREHLKDWSKFKEQYIKELQDPRKQELMRDLLLKSKGENITLLYGGAKADGSAAGVVYELLHKE